MHKSIIDETNRVHAANGWDPLRIAPPGARCVSVRRVAAARGTDEDLTTPPDDRAAAGYPAPGSGRDHQVTQILELIAKVNGRGEGARLRVDFNSQLLALALDSKSRASVGSVLQRLVANGLVRRRAEDEYSVTEAGVLAMRRATAAMATP